LTGSAEESVVAGVLFEGSLYFLGQELEILLLWLLFLLIFLLFSLYLFLLLLFLIFHLILQHLFVKEFSDVFNGVGVDFCLGGRAGGFFLFLLGLYFFRFYNFYLFG